MALVYAHLVVHDFQQLELLSTTVSRAIALFQSLDCKDILRALIAPLYLVGIVAPVEARPYFCSVFSSPPLSDSFLQHRARILPVLEAVWEKSNTPGFTWADCVTLASGVLLV